MVAKASQKVVSDFQLNKIALNQYNLLSRKTKYRWTAN